MGKGLRFSRVPWLTTASDLRPMGEPETSVECGPTIALGLYIPYPFGPGSDTTLVIRATRGNGNDGGVISLAIGSYVTTSDPEEFPSQSGTDRRRWLEDDDITREIE